MFFSRLGPATAAHSAYGGRRASVNHETQPESPVDSLPVTAPARPPSLGLSRRDGSPQSLLAARLPSYLQKLAVIGVLGVGLPEEPKPVLPGDELSPGAGGAIWMQPLTCGQCPCPEAVGTIIAQDNEQL